MFYTLMNNTQMKLGTEINWQPKVKKYLNYILKQLKKTEQNIEFRIMFRHVLLIRNNFPDGGRK